MASPLNHSENPHLSHRDIGKRFGIVQSTMSRQNVESVEVFRSESQTPRGTVK